jgi:thioredoxin 2
MKTHVVCPHCNSTNRVATAQLEAELSCGSCHKPLFDKHPASLTSICLAAQIAKSEVPVVVDFWAPWCGPCRMMAPEYEKACAMLEPHARFVKVDTEAHQEVGAQHHIRSIPTLAIFKGGKEVARISGARSAADLAHWVRAEISK